MDSGPGDEMLLAAVAGRDMGAFRTPAAAAPASAVEVAMVTASISLREGQASTFGATRALAGVDLDLKPGVTGLLGPQQHQQGLPRCCAC